MNRRDAARTWIMLNRHNAKAAMKGKSPITVHPLLPAVFGLIGHGRAEVMVLQDLEWTHAA